MSSAAVCPTDASAGELQLATFYVGDLLLGLQIDQVQEINRRLDFTRVPHALDSVRGVINLRGEVVTVIDLRNVLGLGDSQATAQSRNLIVNYNDELIGLWVDRIADIVNVSSADVNPTPSNVNQVDSKHFQGVVPLKDEIIVVLNLASILDFD